MFYCLKTIIQKIDNWPLSCKSPKKEPDAEGPFMLTANLIHSKLPAAACQDEPTQKWL